MPTSTPRGSTRSSRRTSNGPGWRVASGVGLPVQLLQPAPEAAALLAPGLRGAARRSRGTRRYRDRRGYGSDADGVTVSEDHLRSSPRHHRVRRGSATRHRAAAAPAELLRVARVGDGLPQRAVRHERVPLRLARRAPTQCRGRLRDRYGAATSTPTASSPPTPRHETPESPSRATQKDWEQPGCVAREYGPVQMALQSSPLIDSELLLDCLELAAAARESTCGPARTT